MIFYIILIIAFIPCCLIFPTKLVGKKNLPKKGKVILACNHQSNCDAPILIYKLSKRRIYFMAKEELFKNKFFGWFLKKMGAFSVKRGANDINAIKTTLTHLKKGHAVCLFPEGSRLVSSEKNELKNGTAMMALKTASPIVPTYFIKKTKPFTKNILVLGKPFVLNEMEMFKDKKIDKELLDEASKIISQKMFECRNEYFEMLHNKKSKIKKRRT